MRAEIIDLYGQYEYEKMENTGGALHCWIPDPIPAVNPRRKRPAVLILPGGGYGHTSDREAEPVALHFAARGWAAFVLRYSCAPNRHPAQLREAAMAMGCIRRRAEEFGIDPCKVAAIGFSAGGHLCGMLGTLYDSEAVQDIGPARLLRPDALGLCYPVAVSWGNTHGGSFRNLCGGDPALTAALSLDRLVRPDMPPVFLWHTRSDESVPCRNTLELARALEMKDVDFAMHIYRRGCHGLSTADSLAYPTYALPLCSRDVGQWMDSMVCFFEELGLAVTDLEGDR